MKPIRVALFVTTILCLALSAQATVLETLDAARDAGRAGQHSVAAALYGELVTENPFKGSYWSAYASANHSLGNYGDAIVGWQRSLELEFTPRYTMFNLACANALNGDLETAVDWIETAYTAGFVDQDLISRDTDLDALRDNPRFVEITGLRPPTLLDRGARWRRDIEFMRRRMEEVHWDVYAKVSREEFLRRTEELAARVSEMNDGEILTEMRKIVVLVGDGHTALYVPSATVFPLDFYWFEEGVYVRGTHEQNRDLAGKRVVAVGNQTIEEAIALAEPLISRDNGMWIRQNVPGILRNPIYMKVLGLTPSQEYLDLTLEDASGRRETARVTAMPMAARNQIRPVQTGADELPLYLRNQDRNYWFTHLADENLLYCQYNSVRDQENESIAEFTERLFTFIEEQEVNSLVLDIRFNHGGNSFLNRPLLREILSSRINERGRFWVVIGRGTFSAAQNFASDLDFRTRALFVGEPTGSRPNFVGETSIVVLPYSGTSISVSSRYHQHSSSNDYRSWISPDVAAPPTWASYVAGEDPALKAILAELATEGGAPVTDP